MKRSVELARRDRPERRRPATSSLASSRTLPVLGRFLRANGVDFAERHGLVGVDLEDPELEVPASTLAALWEEAGRIDPAIGFRLFDGFGANDPHVIVHLASRADTVGEALAMWCRFAPLVIEGDRAVMSVDGEEATLTLHFAEPLLAPFLAEHSAALLSGLARRNVGKVIEPKAVCFRHERPAEVRAIAEERLGLAPRWGADANQVTFPRSALDLPLATADRNLRSYLLPQAEARLREREARATVTAAARRAIAARLDRGEALSTELVAADLRLAKATLLARLRDEGTGWKVLLDDVRRELAGALVLRGFSAKEAGYLLGFSEPAAFQHAFRRWYGRAPGEYRRGGGESA